MCCSLSLHFSVFQVRLRRKALFFRRVSVMADVFSCRTFLLAGSPKYLAARDTSGCWDVVSLATILISVLHKNKPAYTPAKVCLHAFSSARKTTILLLPLRLTTTEQERSFFSNFCSSTCYLLTGIMLVQFVVVTIQFVREVVLHYHQHLHDVNDGDLKVIRI